MIVEKPKIKVDTPVDDSNMFNIIIITPWIYVAWNSHTKNIRKSDIIITSTIIEHAQYMPAIIASHRRSSCTKPPQVPSRWNQTFEIEDS